MTELIMKSDGHSLQPTDHAGLEILGGFTRGEELRVKVTRLRNGKFHRLFFALVKLAYDHQDQFATSEQLRDALLRAVGYVEARTDLEGQIYYVTKSMSFAKMDETSFKELFDKVLKVILEKIVPGVNQPEFEQAVFDMIKEPGPNVLR